MVKFSIAIRGRFTSLRLRLLLDTPHKASAISAGKIIYSNFDRAVVETEVASSSFFEKVAKICGGCLAPLIAHLTEKQNLRPDELAQLKELISRHEETKNDKSEPEV